MPSSNSLQNYFHVVEFDTLRQKKYLMKSGEYHVLMGNCRITS
jgi:hypothetical protein